jgi:DNA polymerase-3 subunit delta
MFYIFHGEDSHTKEETLAQLMKKLGDPATLELNTTRFEGLVPVAILRQAAETMPFLAPARVVIVTDLFAAKPGKDYIKELFAFLPVVPQTTRLIFLESQMMRDSHAAIKLANQEDQGIQRAYPLPKGGQLESWIHNQVRKKGGEIAPRAAALLASLVGSDLRVLDNELEKLVVYKQTAESGRIDPDDVMLLSPYVAEASIFDLVDALGNRNGKAASTLYQRKLNEGADPFYLFSMFVRQFRLLIQAKELADEGYNSLAIAGDLGLHNFVAGKLHQQARGFSMAELELIYRHLLNIDAAVKSGQADMRTELDLLLANLTITV